MLSVKRSRFLGAALTTLRDVVGVRIKNLRKKAGLSQSELAERIGTDAPLISRYERGVTLPSIEVLIKLSSALKVSPAELLPGEHDEIREKLISLRRKIADLAMRIDCPEQLEKVLEYMETAKYDLD